MYSFVDRDMFMRYRGGAVGHKTTQDETRCLLDDRDELNKAPFKLECEQDWYASASSDVEMGSGDDGENTMEEDVEEGTESREHGDGGSDLEEGESEGGDEDQSSSSSSDDESDSDDAAVQHLGISASLADDELLDEMDEFRYTGLDQIVDEEEELDYQEDDLGAEDGENMDWDELEPLVYL